MMLHTLFWPCMILHDLLGRFLPRQHRKDTCQFPGQQSRLILAAAARAQSKGSIAGRPQHHPSVAKRRMACSQELRGRRSCTGEEQHDSCSNHQVHKVCEMTTSTTMPMTRSTTMSTTMSALFCCNILWSDFVHKTFQVLFVVCKMDMRSRVGVHCD
jgi:hypothetical protein